MYAMHTRNIPHCAQSQEDVGNAVRSIMQQQKWVRLVTEDDLHRDSVLLSSYQKMHKVGDKARNQRKYGATSPAVPNFTVEDIHLVIARKWRAAGCSRAPGIHAFRAHAAARC